MNEIASWLHERLAADEDLDQPRLARLGGELAGERSFW
jgi:hypothetical protein